MSKNIYSFKSKDLPGTILLDSSYILNLTARLTGCPSSNISECEYFAISLRQNNCEIYITDWVIQEVLQRITGINIKQAFENIIPKRQRELDRIIKGRPIKPIDYYKVYPDIMTDIYPKLEKIYNKLISLSRYRKLEESSFEIRRMVLHLIKTNQMLPPDAYIIATALVNKKEAIATCDKDFKRVSSQIKIYLPNNMI